MSTNDEVSTGDDSASADAAGAATSADGGSVAEQVAAAVLAVPGVTGLHGGLFGEVATYLPGGRVSGVALDDESGEVHIIVDLTSDLRAVATAARRAGEEVAGFPLHVTVEDISRATETAGERDTYTAAPGGSSIVDRTRGESR